MQKVEPKVYLLASTAIDFDAVDEWLSDLGGTECQDHISGSDAEMLIELAGRRCYRSFSPGLNPNVTRIRTDSALYHRNVLESRHGSVLEHATATWAFENVSRVFTHELVRHRAGNAFSQESLRYVRLSDGLKFWLPPQVEESPEAERIFIETADYLSDRQKELSALFGIDSAKDFATKKLLTSAFRRIAPMGLSTGIIFTCNMRSLRFAIEQRTSRFAEYEIRLVFNRVADIANSRWPMVFQDFEVLDTEDNLKEWKPKNSKV